MRKEDKVHKNAEPDTAVCKGLKLKVVEDNMAIK